MSLRALTQALGLVLLLGLGSREDADGAPDERDGLGAAAVAPTPVTVPWVLYTGCREVHPGHRCEIEPGATLTIWAEVDPRHATLRVDGSPVEAKVEVVEGGSRWTVTLPSGARRVEAHAEGEGVSRRFSLVLEERAREWMPVLAAIEAWPDHAVARRVLARLLPQLRGGAQVQGLALAGVLADRADDLDARFEAYERGVAAAQAMGWPREASDMAQRIAYGCIVLHYDEACAQRWLEHDAMLVGEDSERQITHAYYEGLLADRRDDADKALRLFHEQGPGARRLGLVSLEAAAILEEMVLVGRLGDRTRTSALLARVLALAPELHERMRSQLINGAASMLLDARARGVESEDPRPLLKSALELAGDDDDAITVRSRQTILLNLAYAAVLDEQGADARQWLDRVDTRALTYEDHHWRSLLRARVALLAGDAEQALRHFTSVAAEPRPEPDLQWHALIGRGRAQEALGRPLEARASYEAAEAWLEAQTLLIARSQGREPFMAERDRGARELVRLLLGQGDEEAALCTARLARTRSVRLLARQRHVAASMPELLEAQARYHDTRTRLEKEHDATWTLPKAAASRRLRELDRARRANEDALDQALEDATDGEPSEPPTCAQLPRVPAGQLDLHYMELDDGWVGFAVDDQQRITVEDLGPLADAAGREAWPEWGRALLEPFAEPIARAERIRIMPAGSLTRVPFHALPMGSGSQASMLLERAVVRYGFDLPNAAVAAEIPVLARGAALIVVPPSNLPQADAEAQAARAALEQRGWRAELLDGDAARGQSLRAALGRVDLLHYVGHAGSGGPGGWGSRLSLARDDTLEVPDVLALSQVPTTVVLSGCETGLADPLALAGGMSLAQAFVIAGSRQVIASSGPLGDAAAAGLMQDLYRAMVSGEATDVDMALTLAQRRGTDEGRLYVQSFGP